MQLIPKPPEATLPPGGVRFLLGPGETEDRPTIVNPILGRGGRAGGAW